MPSSPPGLWVTDPAAYRQKLKDKLGGRDPLEIITSTPATIAKMVADHTVEQMQTRPYDGKWTPNEIVGHLCDAEWIFGYRIRGILCEDQPNILGMDHEAWVTGQRYNEHDPAELAARFGNLRAANLPVWRQMTPQDLERTGLHNERGPESLDTMRDMLAGHDLSHIDQLTRYLDAVKTGR